MVSNETVTDPLYGGEVVLAKEDLVKFTSGQPVLEELERMVQSNEPIQGVIEAPPEVMNHFKACFPNLVQSNEVGEIKESSLWSSNTAEENKVVVKMGHYSPKDDLEEGYDIYIGGPAAAGGAALQAESGDNAKRIIYGHDARRGTSNWKGSASYFHIRDCVPVYFWPDNHGVYTLYATLKHHFQRWLMPKVYLKTVESEPNWNKLRVNFSNILREPSLIPLLIKNQIHAIKDVGLHIPGTELRPPKERTAYTTTRYADITKEVLRTIEGPGGKPLLVDNRHSQFADAVYTFSGEASEVNSINGTIQQLHNIAGGGLLDHHFLPEGDIKSRGLNPSHVKMAAVFPNDGNFPPYLDTELEDKVRTSGGQVVGHMKLKSILVTPTAKGDDLKVTQIEWKNLATGEMEQTKVNTLNLSLGPSMQSMMLDLGPWIKQNLMGKMMHASGATIVYMVRVDMSKVTTSQLKALRDYIDGHNKHNIRLEEKDVPIEGTDKNYKYFAMQATGGGHFPALHAHAETAINVFKANVVQILGLDKDGFEYDIVQVRSCARGVTAQNVFRFMAPFSNMVSVYGIGGIGMTTIGSNALFMKALLSQRQQLSAGKIDESQYKHNLETCNFDQIPHWQNRQNPFKGLKIAPFIDNINQPKFAWKKSQLAMPKIHSEQTHSPNLALSRQVLSGLTRMLKR